MEKTDTFSKFIQNGDFSHEKIEEIMDYYNVSEKQLVRKTFKYLGDEIGVIKDNSFFEIVISRHKAKSIKAIANVTDIWLVCAKLPGNKPNKFSNKTNKNTEKTNGTYLFPLSPSEPATTFFIIDKDTSSADWKREGTFLLNFPSKKPNNNPKKTTMPKTITPFVILKLWPKNSIFTKFFSSNWCIGFIVAPLLITGAFTSICFYFQVKFDYSVVK